MADNFALQSASEAYLPDLNKYFPKDMKVFEYTAAYDTTSSTTLGNITKWLQAKENRKFTFQCLICSQEMSFGVVFWTTYYYLNRSHLLTEKHKNRVALAGPTIGLLFNSDKKFVLSNERDFTSKHLFELIKKVSRKPGKILKNPRILNVIFCEDYEMYEFDKHLCKVSEIDFKGDLVNFMRLHVRPLFQFCCLFCEKILSTYTKVVEHLRSRRHQNKSNNRKIILSFKAFNVFLICSFEMLTCLLYLKHLNNFGEEMIIATNGTILISGLCDDTGKNTPSTLNAIETKTVILPDNRTVENSSVNIRMPIFNALREPESSSAMTKSHINYQKNVTIYEFCNQDQMGDNIILSVISHGFRIWCSRCKIAIRTLDEFEDHLVSQLHNKQVRNNETIGFMCKECRTFFIELKGESILHSHSSVDNKQIMEVLNDTRLQITGNTVIYTSILVAYTDILKRVSEPLKFCCLICCDLTKKKIVYLPDHENNHHKTTNINIVFTFCEFCKVIYISTGDRNNVNYFYMEHFCSHLENNESMLLNMWSFNLATKQNIPFYINIDCTALSDRIRQTSKSSSQNVKMSLSKFFDQLMYPGISFDEFGDFEEWTHESLSKYLPEKIESFTCVDCHISGFSRLALLNHVFESVDHRQYGKTYLKFCNICKKVLLSSDLLLMQQHFLDHNHIQRLLTTSGLTYIELDEVEIKKSAVNLLKEPLFGSKQNLIHIIYLKVIEMRRTFCNQSNNLESLKIDLRKLIKRNFPEASLSVYGSRLSGLALKESDCDICIGVGEDNFNTIDKIICEAQDIFKIRVSLPESSKPIIRVTHIKTGLHCDLCFSLVWDIQFGKIVKILLDFDERVYWLVAAVRCWTEITKLRGPQLLSSPAITWLVFFYLMQPDVRVIPPISLVFDLLGGKENILNKDISSLSWDNEPQGFQLKSETELLKGFFEYYSLLNFPACKLCPLSGFVLPRTLSRETPMFIIDPFYENNFMEKTSMQVMKKFQSLCYFTLHTHWRIK